LTGLLAFVAVTPAAQAAEPAGPCDAPAYHQLDFWVGHWRVYDNDTGQVVAEDRIKKTYAGCIVEQDLTFTTDMYRHDGVSYRLAGTSISRFDGQQWLQLWADNQWGAIIMKGAPGKDGSMVFDTVIPSRGRDVRLIWEQKPGGVVEILQYVASTGSGAWTKYGDLIYRPDPTP
jgi:hypothetical protein